MSGTYTEHDQDLDFDWFLSVYDELYKKYGHKFFVIRNKQIIGIYDGLVEAINKTKETLGLKCGDFLVQECTGDESGYTLYGDYVFRFY